MSDTRYEIVKGGREKNGYYDIKVVDNSITIRFYQISEFLNDNMHTIRSYLFKGDDNCNGSCCYEYKILEINNYLLSERDLKKFIKVLKNKKNTQNKIIFKYYPVYDFKYVEPPETYLLSQCNSELLR